ncbi:MAG: pyridoxine 5'-phosphate synthase [Chitinivibrionales bacterium]|nr:pyridoxine 5'-phosphate synthase [Chitinivibrionales bacterium]
MPTRLSVNVNKIATLRNARGGNLPDVLQTSLDIVSFGAEGITVHPRPDERHIRRQDVYDISHALCAKHPGIEFNIEGYPSTDFLDLVCEVGPHQCTLVPDPPHVLTSNAGWQVARNEARLIEVMQQLHEAQVRTSIFIDVFNFTDEDMESLVKTESDRVELYTERYAREWRTDTGETTLERYAAVAGLISQAGIALNAGHDLNLSNITAYIKAIPQTVEVSIGHALICDALYLGLQQTIVKYLACLRNPDITYPQ